MPKQAGHDGPPPPGWSQGVVYLTRPRLSPSFPAELVVLLYPASTGNQKFSPRPIAHPVHLAVKTITAAGHPANGQAGLFAKKKIGPNELLIPYLGVIHATFTPSEDLDANSPIPPTTTGHDESDYDLSLLRLSSADARNPFKGHHLSIGVDAAVCGNAARFVNDYRGIGTAANAEFRLGQGEGGELRMEVWSLKNGVGKGDEVLVSYGKGWWGARRT